MQNTPHPMRSVRFGVFEVDFEAGELRKSGLKVELQEQPFHVLALLLENAGKLVSRDELQQKIWSADTFVEFDRGLNTAINKVRDALGDSARSPRFIETLPRRGYRFLASVESERETAQVTRPSTADTSGAESYRLGLKTRREQLTWLGAIVVLILTALTFVVTYLHHEPTQVGAIRFSVPPLEGGNSRTLPLISPDGRRLAFSGHTSDGRTLLWVRPLNSLTAQPLLGTEGADLPFWSPDSRFIGFAAGEKLKKIDASGGPAQTICNVWAFDGGTWNRDGVIVFAAQKAPTSGSSSPPVLYRVAATGGEATPVSTLDLSRGEFGHWLPYFLPDGRHFLYSVGSQQRANRGTYVGSLDSLPELKDGQRRPNRDWRRLVQADWAARYARPGYLLFVRDGTLVAQRFDAEKLQSSDEAFPVAEEVLLIGPHFNEGLFSVSENGVLVYRSGSASKTQLVWFDRGGNRLASVGAPGEYSSEHSEFALSPDGNRVAIARADPQTRRKDIWLVELLRGTASRFTFDPSDDETPVWSPDGSRIVFASNRDGSFNLYVKAANGVGKEELLLSSSENKFPTDWSHDGRFIVYKQWDAKKKFDLWVLPLDGNSKPFPFSQTEFGKESGALSPDGRWVAYFSDESGIRQEVYVQAFTSKALAGSFASGGRWQISTKWGFFPRWRRDGKELFYFAMGDGDEPNRIMAIDVTGSSAFRAGVPRALFETRGDFYEVTSEGQRFLIRIPVEDTAPPPIIVVLNWTAGLKR